MRKALRTIAFKGFGLLVLLTAACLARAQDAKHLIQAWPLSTNT